jgi:hypothetical protein
VNAIAARAPAPSRLSRRRVVLIVMGGFAAVVVVTILLAALLAPAAPKAVCPDDRPCGEPPKAEPLVNTEVWRSSELGFSFEYSADRWKVLDEGSRGARLEAREGDFVLVVSGTRASERSPKEALDAALDDSRGRILGLDDDTEPAHKVLAPAVGLHPGVAGSFAGTLDTPQGTSVPIGLVILAAGNPRVTVSVLGATGESSEHNRKVLMSRSDSLLNTLRLPGDPAPR